MKIIKVIFLTLTAFIINANAAKILGVFHFHGKSHFIMFEALMKGLAEKGHEVTVVSHFPQDPPLKNYKDISLKGSLDDLVNNVTIPDILKNWIGTMDMFMFIWKTAGVELCDFMHQNPVIKDVINSKEKYDLLITEFWGSDCFLGLSHKFKVPHISMISTMEVPWALGRYASPFNPAVQTNHFTTFSPRGGLSFWQRVYNTLLTVFIKVGHYYVSEVNTDQVIKKHLGDDTPSLSDMIRNSSLLLINAHFSTIGPRPLSPNIIEVGGLHIPQPKPLPSDIQSYLDEAKEGVIVFSLGSLIKSETFEQAKLDSFLNVFRKLPQKILWKYGGKIENQPKNLKTAKWLPQSDVLRHPNVKLFITHGGLMGTQEAVLAGVPMIGIPFFADQRFNVRNYKELGFALDLELDDINQENVEWRVKEILNNPRYEEKAKLYSSLFKDRPLSALDTAIFWTEYVIRHNGAKHLQISGRNLNLYQYYSLDVLAVILGALVLLMYLVVKIIKTILRPLFGKKSVKKLKKN